MSLGRLVTRIFTIIARAVFDVTLLFSDFALRLDTKLPINATNIAIYGHYAVASNYLRYVLIPRPYPKKS
jgi:hypothetical protein